jgi:hypothetical protein
VYEREHVTHNVLAGNTIVKTLKSALGVGLAKIPLRVGKDCGLRRVTRPRAWPLRWCPCVGLQGVGEVRVS